MSITALQVVQGAVVEAGSPVVTLTLMDPIQVAVEVSAEDERSIRDGDRAVLLPRAPWAGGERGILEPLRLSVRDHGQHRRTPVH